MRLKSLEITGFKSFAEKTVLNFTSEVTGVVGPNGCGKSNVVDALRWVMGEQNARQLRGQVMEDVIFNGSEKLNAVGMAEVSLTLENLDRAGPAEYGGYTEIAVTRRLFRSGESEYFINKVPCRLRDIIELFMGTGVGNKAYSIIGQGRVEETVNAKPEERRRIIEEAAGTSRFKSRKLAAERKMERTRQNLLRVNDIVREVERQVRSIELQAKKAERYKALREELKVKELRWASIRRHTFQGEITRGEEELAGLENSTAQLMATLRAREAENERNRLEVLESDKGLAAIQERVYQRKLEIQNQEQKITLYDQDEANLLAGVERAKADARGLEAKIEVLSREIEKLGKANEDYGQLSLFEQEYVQQKEGELENLRSRIEALQTQLNDDKHRLIESLNALSSLKNEKLSHERRTEQVKGELARKEQYRLDTLRSLDSLKEQLGVKLEALEACHRRMEEVRQSMAGLGAQIEEYEKARERCAMELDALKEELHQVRSNLASLEALQKSFEGYQEGVRAVMLKHESNGHSDGIYGLVADVIDAPERYEKALTAVLGERLQYVIVQGHENGLAAIDYLKRESAGRGSFIPVKLRESAAGRVTLDQPEIVGPLLGLVSVREGYQEVAEYLLGDVGVVTDLDSGLSLWQRNGFRHSLVTLDGEVIDPMGVVTGGSMETLEGSPISQRRRLKELSSRLSEIEEEVRGRETSLKRLKEEMHAAESRKSKLAEESHGLEIERVQLDEQHLQAQREISRFQEHLELLGTEQQDLSAEMASLTASIGQCEAAIQKGSDDKMEREGRLARSEASLLHLAEELRGAETQVTESRIRAAAVKEKQEHSRWSLENCREQRSDLLRQVNEHQTAVEQMTEKTEELRTAREQTAALLEGTRARLQSEERALVAERNRYRELSRLVGETDEVIRDLRPVLERAQEDKTRVQLHLSEKRIDLRHLDEEIREKYSVELRDFTESPEVDDGGPEEELPEEIEDLKGRMQRMGEVNLTAIGEFEELTTRGQFLREQKEDLERSLADLQETITKLNRICRVRFKESFEEINLKFQEIFPRLFNGGKARLVLTDETNYLETGVDIVAQPPGKKLQSITLLSGGEKALTAVSLLFAIFLTKPSPFCFLDEVDAPLDDANIDRFVDIVQEMTQRSQFTLITHNKKTMQASNVLYGITMSDPGVSKVVSVKMV